MKTEIILDNNFSDNPACLHGPTILFSRGNQNFYACSAFRSRKLCPFYMEVSKWAKDKEQLLKKKQANQTIIVASEAGEGQNVEDANLNPRKRKRGLHDNIHCSSSSNTSSSSTKAKIKKLDDNCNNSDVSAKSLAKADRTDNKGQAQFLFSQNSITFILNLLETLEIRKVICVGVPTIHSQILAAGKLSSSNSSSGTTSYQPPHSFSYLLDIDPQFDQLANFSRYNMCNHYFFNEADQSNYTDFLSSCQNNSVALICDPPFGARLELILNSLALIRKDLQNCCTADHGQLIPDPKVLLIHPYFSEGKILKIDSTLRMCDYKIEYETHKKYKQVGKSPVRLFTNVPLSQISFPSDKSKTSTPNPDTTSSDKSDYKYCSKCEKFVYAISKHCQICNSCNSRDGKPTVHCSKCNCCVKSSWTHCSSCSKCHFPGNSCKLIAGDRNRDTAAVTSADRLKNNVGNGGGKAKAKAKKAIFGGGDVKHKRTVSSVNTKKKSKKSMSKRKS